MIELRLIRDESDTNTQPAGNSWLCAAHEESRAQLVGIPARLQGYENALGLGPERAPCGYGLPSPPLREEELPGAEERPRDKGRREDEDAHRGEGGEAPRTTRYNGRPPKAAWNSLSFGAAPPRDREADRPLALFPPIDPQSA